MKSGETIRVSNGVQHGLLGGSPAIAAVVEFIGSAASRKSTVLIQGESGTGKELVAQAIHRNSSRSSGPFITVNCAAFPESLAESELFGHQRGSFTGAVAHHKGCFESAHTGTLFLDEMGEISPSIQAKLLRALDCGEIQRIGGQPIRVDVRILAATNRDLKSLVAKGEFREDLYYRLKTLCVKLAPLRDRREDVPLLARHFARYYAGEEGRPAPDISAEADFLLQQYDWPGNVRELRHVMEQTVALGCGATIRPEDLPEDVRFAAASSPELPAQPEPALEIAHLAKVQPLRQAMLQKKREYVAQVLNLAGGDYKLAASLLDIPANGFHSVLRRLDLRHLL